MALKVEREIEGIESIGALREALAELALVEDVPLSDGFGDPLTVIVCRDMETSQIMVEIR